MHYMDISSLALQGVQQAQMQFDQAAQRVASLGSGTAGGGDTLDLSAAAVALLLSKNQFSAELDVLKIADEMQKKVASILG